MQLQCSSLKQTIISWMERFQVRSGCLNHWQNWTCVSENTVLCSFCVQLVRMLCKQCFCLVCRSSNVCLFCEKGSYDWYSYFNWYSDLMCPHFSYLNAANNQLTGTIPTEIKALSSLQDTIYGVYRFDADLFYPFLWRSFLSFSGVLS